MIREIFKAIGDMIIPGLAGGAAFKETIYLFVALSGDLIPGAPFTPTTSIIIISAVVGLIVFLVTLNLIDKATKNEK